MSENARHCLYCGGELTGQTPRQKCPSCGRNNYQNPIPVAVALLTVNNGHSVVLVERAIQPQQGKLALIGGYIETSETWQDAICREIHEEVGLQLLPETVKLFSVESTPDGRQILIFGVVETSHTELEQVFRPNSEASDLIITEHGLDLAFPLHTKVLGQYLGQKK